jgi:hypothetical protein
LNEISNSKEISDTVKNLYYENNAKFDLLVEIRKRFLKDLIAKYWEYHDRNYTTPAAMMLLIQSANSDLDKEAEELESWNWIKS